MSKDRLTDKTLKSYTETVTCPKGHVFDALRRPGTAGRTVKNYCISCGQEYKFKVGPAPKGLK